MEVGFNEFLTIFMLTFALFLLVAGIFTAYFGSGKSRKIGGGLLGLGLVLGLVWILISSTFILDEPMIEVSLKTVIIQSVLVIVSAALGAAAAIGMFLAAIMKA
jgi:hypothetical protein